MQTTGTMTRPPATDTYRNMDAGQAPAFAMPQAPVFPAPPQGAPQTQTLLAVQRAQPAPAQPEEKTRRAGTVTMAMVLIAAGALLITHIFIPSLDLMLIARFSPLVLVLLGTEILVLNLLGEGKKLKYDFLSMFVCFLLVCASGVAALAGEWYRREAGTRGAEQRLTGELHTRTTDALASAGLGYYVDEWNVYLGEAEANAYKDMAVDAIPAWAYVALDLHFDKAFSSPAAFAKACGGYLASLAATAPHMDNVLIASSTAAQPGAEGERYYELSLSGSQNMGLPAAELEKRVSTFVWTADGYAVPEAEYAAMQADAELAAAEAAEAEALAGAVEEPLPPAIPEAPEAPVAPEMPESPEAAA